MAKKYLLRKGQFQGREKPDAGPSLLLLSLFYFVLSVVSSGQDLWHFGYCRYLVRTLRTAEQIPIEIEGCIPIFFENWEPFGGPPVLRGENDASTVISKAQ